jgi:hypothetical protein
MNSFETIFRTNSELIEALSHARDKSQRLPSLDGANPDLLFSRWSQVKTVADLQHRLTRFNIFMALNALDYETRHSNFLAWLLNPSGTHGFGTKFLNGFLSLVARKMPKGSVTGELQQILRGTDRLQGAIVDRELKGADLLIVDRTRRFVCLVENKIHTREHSEQLTRYRRMVEQEYSGFEHLFVFLTLRSEAPSDSAYVPLTYAELCCELKQLTHVKGTVAPVEGRALLFQQYVEFLRSFEAGTKTRPNAFSALRLREIKHSDFFAWLFNPRETHYLDIGPVKEFFRLVHKKRPSVQIPTLIGGKEGGDWEMHREVHNIDLLVVNERAKFVCLIENKLDAREGKDQLQRYKAFVRNRYRGFEAVFVFFTLRGDKPTDPDYVAMRFSELVPYFESALKSLPHRDLTDSEVVAVLLDHYRALLNDRLSLRLNTRVELAPEMAKSCEGLFQREGALIPAILSGVHDWQETVRLEMETFIGELIVRAFGKTCFRPRRFPRPFDVYLPFVPDEFDAIPPLKEGGADPAYQGQIFNFVFLNLPFTNPFKNAEPLGITLRAGMKPAKPGYHELREAIYRLAKEDRALFNCADNECVGNQKNCLVLSQTLCTAEDFRRLDLFSVKEKLERRFQRFVKNQYPTILRMLLHASVAKYKSGRA